MGSIPDEDSVIQFPCDFLVKVMGKNTPAFNEAVVGVVKDAFPNITEQSFSNRLSKNGGYLSISISLYVSSKSDLDALYTQLSAIEGVKMVL